MIKISLDLSKIDKSKIKKTEKGQQFYDIIVDTRKEVDTYGNTHTVYESQSKEEREAKKTKNYIGNGKEHVFNNQQQNAPVQQQQGNNAGWDTPPTIDDLPF